MGQCSTCHSFLPAHVFPGCAQVSHMLGLGLEKQNAFSNLYLLMLSQSWRTHGYQLSLCASELACLRSTITRRLYAVQLCTLLQHLASAPFHRDAQWSGPKPFSTTPPPPCSQSIVWAKSYQSGASPEVKLTSLLLRCSRAGVREQVFMNGYSFTHSVLGALFVNREGCGWAV